MGFLNKEKRIKYLGFNDIWFVITGILLLSFITDFMFSRGSFTRLPFIEATINWSVSLMFSVLDWLIIRAILIELRKRYPTLQDNRKRIPLFFLSIVMVVFAVDYLGNAFLGYVFNETYNHPARFRICLLYTSPSPRDA